MSNVTRTTINEKYGEVVLTERSFCTQALKISEKPAALLAEEKSKGKTSNDIIPFSRLETADDAESNPNTKQMRGEYINARQEYSHNADASNDTLQRVI